MYCVSRLQLERGTLLFLTFVTRTYPPPNANRRVDKIVHSLYISGAIYNQVVNRGTYTHTFEELVHGARVCWRNSAK